MSLVREAAIAAVPRAAPSHRLPCRVLPDLRLPADSWWPERIEVVAEVDVEHGAQPLPTGSFGWRVLECLAEEVTACALPAQPPQRGRVRITLGEHATTALPWD